MNTVYETVASWFSVDHEVQWDREWVGDLDYVEHRGSVWWHDTAVPRRWHRCRAQSRGWVGLNYYERCACGGLNINRWGWVERNAR